MATIQPADPQQRRRAITAVALVCLLGVPLSMLGQRWLATVHRLPAEDARQTVTTVFLTSTSLAAAGILAVGVQSWRVGARVRHARRFPAPGARMIRDTLVFEGAAAVVRGRWLQAVGAALMLGALCLVVASWMVLAKRGLWPG